MREIGKGIEPPPYLWEVPIGVTRPKLDVTQSIGDFFYILFFLTIISNDFMKNNHILQSLTIAITLCDIHVTFNNLMHKIIKKKTILLMHQISVTCMPCMMTMTVNDCK